MYQLKICKSSLIPVQSSLVLTESKRMLTLTLAISEHRVYLDGVVVLITQTKKIYNGLLNGASRQTLYANETHFRLQHASENRAPDGSSAAFSLRLSDHLKTGRERGYAKAFYIHHRGVPWETLAPIRGAEEEKTKLLSR